MKFFAKFSTFLLNSEKNNLCLFDKIFFSKFIRKIENFVKNFIKNLTFIVKYFFLIVLIKNFII